MKTSARCLLTLVATLLAAAAAPRAQQSAAPPAPALKPTNHPPLPADLSQFWLAPARPAAATAAMSDLAAAVKFEVDGNFTRALPLLQQPGVRQGVLGSYAEYYQGIAELRLGRPSEARQTFQALGAKNPVGFLAEASALREAEAAEAQSDLPAALAIYERLAKAKTTAPDEVLMRLGRAAKGIGAADKAIEAFSRVLYEFPFGDLAPIAESELQALPIPPIVPGSNRYKLELGRGERLFGARRYTQARVVFDALRAAAQGDDRELVQLRIAECDYFQRKARAARDGVRPFTERHRARARRCSSMRSRAAMSATTRNTCASFAAWSTSSRPRAGRKRR
jgi:tetratricopeptide (TPR) repeat protein